MELGPAERQLEQLAVADRPGGTAMALPLSRQDERWPAELTGGAADGRISTAGTAMEQQMHQPATAAGQQLRSDAGMPPAEAAAAAGNDHQRSAGRRTAQLQMRRRERTGSKRIHAISCVGMQLIGASCRG